ncbi:MAG: hypothetical protein FH756_03535 [Firmicutes bacterium]|nr:hypothetical protein [Bacillota bacterium]
MQDFAINPKRERAIFDGINGIRGIEIKTKKRKDKRIAFYCLGLGLWVFFSKKIVYPKASHTKPFIPLIPSKLT